MQSIMDHSALYLQSEEVERVESVKLLGVHFGRPYLSTRIMKREYHEHLIVMKILQSELYSITFKLVLLKFMPIGISCILEI